MSANVLEHPAQTIPSEEEVVARATALIPLLKERAEQCERDRMVSSDTIQRFMDAGFFKILLSKRWGGWEMNPKVFYRVLMELGRGCGSSAWNMGVLGIHQWEFGIMDPKAGDDVFGPRPNAIVASSYAPFGTCTRVDGGYMLDGVWRTSSGCDHGDWVFLGANVFNADGAPVNRLALLIPAADFTIEDDWYVFGLAGTGSKSVIVKNVFVPEHRVHSQLNYQPDGRPLLYRLPFHQAFYTSVASTIVGMAQGAIDEYQNQMKVRSSLANNTPAVVSPYVKDRLGNAVVRVRSSRARLLQALDESFEFVKRGERVPNDVRMHHLLDIARVGRECEEATLLLFKATGARGMFSSNPMQRILRNVIAASQHITQNSDDPAGWLGGRLLGLELPPMVFEPIAA